MQIAWSLIIILINEHEIFFGQLWFIVRINPIKEVVPKNKMEIFIKRRTSSPSPLNGHNFQPFFVYFFSFAIESYIYETDFTLGLSQKYHF